MIKKLIRKLFGQESADSNESAANDIPADSPDAKPARKSTRKKAAAPVKRDPNVPVILSSDIHGIDPSLISKNAVRVTDGLQHAGHRAFIVGGAVRDLLLGIEPKDFDLATDATPEQVKPLFRRAFIIGRRFRLVRVMTLCTSHHGFAVRAVILISVGIVVEVRFTVLVLAIHRELKLLLDLLPAGGRRIRWCGGSGFCRRGGAA